MARVALIVPLVEGAEDRARALLAAGPPWAGAAEWTEIVAGSPFIAPDAYAGSGQHEPTGVSYESTPGPGDSEGGDVFPPSKRR